MDTIAFLLGILTIVGAGTWLSWFGMTLHHQREIERLRLKEHSDQMRFNLIDKALDKGLPAPRDWHE